MLPTLAHVSINTPNPASTGKRTDRSEEEEETKRNARRQRRAARFSSQNCTACNEQQPNQLAHYGGCIEDPDFQTPSDVSSSDEEEECETCEPDATTVTTQPFYPTRCINSADVRDASDIVSELLKSGAPKFQYDYSKTINENAADLVNLIVSHSK